ncbi:MAG TPA: UDP-3-O-acyl-N-acetylglucosamine deacetylase [Trueperaceae bacterium]|nr:UDP-3-O-acyl-N-acetylglucosamine deacetylase [Trueperaceae bacterium]
MTSLEGIGVHTGVRCRVTLHRVDGPVRFRRNGTDIPATLDAVVDSRRATTLGVGRERIAVVEHLLAALAMRGFWSGVLVEASAPELPILDGSARDWYALAGELADRPPPPPPLRPDASLTLHIDDARAELRPGPAELCYGIAFDHPAIGEQHWCGGPDRYPELVEARTFGFLSELESLISQGLASGANLGNAIVFGEEGPLVPLRAEDEPVRHKALDALGDLFLLARPLDARVAFWRGSHRVHVAFMRELVASHSHPRSGPGQ